MLLVLLLGCQSLFSQSETTPKSTRGQYCTWTPESMSFHIPQVRVANLQYTVHIAGDTGELIKTVPDLTGISFHLPIEALEGMPDGYFKLSFQPWFNVAPDVMATLRRLSDRGDVAALKAARISAGIPDAADLFYFSFSVSGGKFVDPGLVEPPQFSSGVAHLTEPADYSLVASVDGNFFESDLSASSLGWGSASQLEMEMTQVFAEDIIVQGSICVGFDCLTTETFGFTTIKLKENNLRIEFDDTSSSGSFPGNDWELMANESANGGKNLFALVDKTNGKTIFTTEANAPDHSLYIAANGNMGLGTSTPAMKAHAVSGNTPALRLEQNGTGGYPPQTWDVAGNEANFFIRDVTNGSKLPFRIKPDAPDKAIEIQTGGVNINHDLVLLGSLLGASDERLKTNIQPLGNVLSVLMQLIPRQYSFRKDGLAAGLMLPEGPQYGLIAQELEHLLPELVQSDLMVDQPDTGPVYFKGIQYQALIPFLLRGIQEQQELLAGQQAELTELRAKVAQVEDLQKQVEDLARQVRLLLEAKQPASRQD
ncbi:MAG: hypothetical protein RI973_1280 [Bacteroidota bacterium]